MSHPQEAEKPELAALASPNYEADMKQVWEKYVTDPELNLEDLFEIVSMDEIDNFYKTRALETLLSPQFFDRSSHLIRGFLEDENVATTVADALKTYITDLREKSDDLGSLYAVSRYNLYIIEVLPLLSHAKAEELFSYLNIYDRMSEPGECSPSEVAKYGGYLPLKRLLENPNVDSLFKHKAIQAIHAIIEKAPEEEDKWKSDPLRTYTKIIEYSARLSHEKPILDPELLEDEIRFLIINNPENPLFYDVPATKHVLVILRDKNLKREFLSRQVLNTRKNTWVKEPHDPRADTGFIILSAEDEKFAYSLVEEFKEETGLVAALNERVAKWRMYQQHLGAQEEQKLERKKEKQEIVNLMRTSEGGRKNT